MVREQTEEFGRYAPSPMVNWLYGVMNRIYKQGYIGRRAFGRLYWLERLFIGGHRTVVDVQRFGLHWRLHRFGNVSDSRLLRRPDSFETEEIAFILDMAVGNFTFIDVGANCGYWSLRIASRLAGKGSVIAIEPQPAMFERLQFNARVNALRLDHILGCTVGSHSGTAMLTRIAHQSLLMGMDSVIYVNESNHLHTQKSPPPWRHTVQHDNWSLKALLDAGLWPNSTAAA